MEHAAPVLDRIVVSEIGELWSPQTAPARTAPNVAVRNWSPPGTAADDGTGGHGQFQIAVNVSSAAFKHVVAYVGVFHESLKDGSPRGVVLVPVILGAEIVPGHPNYFELGVKSGETPWSIAQQHYGNGNLYH